MNLSQWYIKNKDILNLLIFNVSQKSSCKLLASTGAESIKNRSFLPCKSLILKLPALNEKIRHETWLKTVEIRAGLGELDPQPYWGFDDLHHKAGTKLLNCFYVQAEVKREAGQEFFKYSKILMMQRFNLESFLVGIEQGFVFIDFDARTRHNHGTKFRLRQNKLPMLYSQITEI